MGKLHFKFMKIMENLINIIITVFSVETNIYTS